MFILATYLGCSQSPKAFGDVLIQDDLMKSNDLLSFRAVIVDVEGIYTTNLESTVGR